MSANPAPPVPTLAEERADDFRHPVAVQIEKDSAAYWLRLLTNEDWAALILAQCAERDIDAVRFLRERLNAQFVDSLGKQRK
ncbi:MAG: hypothetical protein AAGA68_26995 [Pseudomonadota bacterium]